MKFQKIIFYISIFFSIFYVSLFTNIYFENIYYLKYDVKNFDKNFLEDQTKNLIGFYLYQNDLNNYWSEKEIKHFFDVKNIFKYLFFLFFLSIVYIIYFIKRFKKINKKIFLYNNLIFFFLTLFILIFFKFFWKKLFHNILFSNDFWINYSDVISYYLFNNLFFIKTIILIFLIFIFINFILYFFSKNFSKFPKTLKPKFKEDFLFLNFISSASFGFITGLYFSFLL